MRSLPTENVIEQLIRKLPARVGPTMVSSHVMLVATEVTCCDLLDAEFGLRWAAEHR